MAVKNVWRGWWVAAVLTLVLSGGSGLLFASGAEATPTSVQPTNCRPGYACQAASFTARSGAATVTQACFANNTTAVVLRRNTQYLEFGVAASCSAGITSFPLYLDTTSLRTGVGSSYVLTLDGVSNASSLPVPSVKGLTSDAAAGRMWKSNASRWSEVGGGAHPVMESQGPTYILVSDRTPSNAPAWAVAPRVGGAALTFTSAGTLTSGGTLFSEPFTSYATTAVAGNQAHHSTSAAFVGVTNRYSARVGLFTTLTNTRAFFGLSSAFPLTAGTSTPTADAAVFRYDSTINGNWWACVSDGAAPLACTDTGVAVLNTSEIQHELVVDCRESAGAGLTTACNFWIDGRPRTRLTTSLPNSSLGFTASVETLTASARSFYFSTVAVEPAVRATP